jgi:hypothetical protein
MLPVYPTTQLGGVLLVIFRPSHVPLQALKLRKQRQENTDVYFDADKRVEEEKKKRGEEWTNHEQLCNGCKLYTGHKKDIGSGSGLIEPMHCLLLPSVKPAPHHPKRKLT